MTKNMNISLTSLPRFVHTPPNVRRFAGDRSGDMVGAYAAEMLLKNPKALVSFTFTKLVDGRWVDLPARMSLGLEHDEHEHDAYNLRTNEAGGPIDAAGSHMVASCACFGEREGKVRLLNPMLLACAIQSWVNTCTRANNADYAILEV